MASKMRPVTEHPNSNFSEVLSNNSEQSIDEHMMKFKGSSGMKQNIKSKPIMGFEILAVQVNLVICIRLIST